MKPLRIIVLTILLLTINSDKMMYSQTTNDAKHSERYTRGWENLKKIDGKAGEKVVNNLKDISPELSQLIIEYSFGDIYNYDKLDNKSKEIVAVASLIAQRAVPEMKVHFNGALNTGCTINEIKEIIIQMTSYVGFPKAICAMNTFKEVLAERRDSGHKDVEGESALMNESKVDRYELGKDYLRLLDKNQTEILEKHYKDFFPELSQYIIEYGYGDIYSRNNINIKYRQIATISALATIGAYPQLKFHLKAGLNIGITQDEMKGVILMMTVYAGFPSAINCTNILMEVLDEIK